MKFDIIGFILVGIPITVALYVILVLFSTYLFNIFMQALIITGIIIGLCVMLVYGIERLNKGRKT